jgi:hypothetical protein
MQLADGDPIKTNVMSLQGPPRTEFHSITAVVVREQLSANRLSISALVMFGGVVRDPQALGATSAGRLTNAAWLLLEQVQVWVRVGVDSASEQPLQAWLQRSACTKQCCGMLWRPFVGWLGPGRHLATQSPARGQSPADSIRGMGSAGHVHTSARSQAFICQRTCRVCPAIKYKRVQCRCLSAFRRGRDRG